MLFFFLSLMWRSHRSSSPWCNAAVVRGQKFSNKLSRKHKCMCVCVHAPCGIWLPCIVVPLCSLLILRAHWGTRRTTLGPKHGAVFCCVLSSCSFLQMTSADMPVRTPVLNLHSAPHCCSDGLPPFEFMCSLLKQFLFAFCICIFGTSTTQQVSQTMFAVPFLAVGQSFTWEACRCALRLCMSAYDSCCLSCRVFFHARHKWYRHCSFWPVLA